MGGATGRPRPGGAQVESRVIPAREPVTWSDALPIRLGNLLEIPFERIWRSPERQRIVEAIHTAPVDCRSCAVYSGCFGGCRGLAHLASGSADPGKPVSEETASSPKAK